MTPALNDALARMPARQLRLIMGGLLAVMAAVVWTLLLRQPVATLRLQAAERARLELVERNPAAQQKELAALERASQQMIARLAPPAARASTQQFQSALIGELDLAAARHGVRLAGATPGQVRTVARMREVPFDLEASGSYQALLEWMAEIERSQANLAILRFELRPADTTGLLAMKIRVSAYLLGEAPQ
jgi:Tfp pilus assembly protein PilO